VFVHPVTSAVVDETEFVRTSPMKESQKFVQERPDLIELIIMIKPNSIGTLCYIL
jgi:hypothetical protein